MDPKRAQLPEHPSNRTPVSRNDMPGGNMGGPFHSGPFPPPMPPYGFGPRGPGPNFHGKFLFLYICAFNMWNKCSVTFTRSRIRNYFCI